MLFCVTDFRPSINITAQIRPDSSDLKLLLIGSNTHPLNLLYFFMDERKALKGVMSLSRLCLD